MASVTEPAAVRPERAAEHVDVVIVGAGLSGIGAAYHLQRAMPSKSYAILEGRDAVGGTWDLFRYPGIRSDSDLHTFGYAFKPWTNRKSIADGPSILRYIRDTASENGIERRIRFGHRVTRAEWSSAEARWTVHVVRADTGEQLQMTCSWLFGATGYYRYEQGYQPAFEGSERFAGRIVHPQHWPEDLDYGGKRVVVIGSGATAVTLVPAMTDRAAHVTMLQRSPTYVISLPEEDALANLLGRVLPAERAYAITRRKNIWLQKTFYKLSQSRPELVKRVLRRGLERRLPPGYDIDRHFTPAYNPWDQRLCAVPDGDLFAAISKGKASVVTDRIETFTERGIRLLSGEELPADIVVTATGLDLVALGEIELVVDGEPVALAERLVYKSAMLGGVPNMAFVFGYTNASWTLKLDLVCEYVCRLLAHMDRFGYDNCTPVNANETMPTRPFLDFEAGYVKRALHKFPKQGAYGPWKVKMSYAEDQRVLRDGPVEDGVLAFARSRSAAGVGVGAGVG
ncbi:MAG TPA: NAD(P)/FAD-dependent oxidoreductase [Solirubrobacteraceae bacterium]|nr:NAD(P)/FAD-dependent oxidoreductase [Solirubrobacteraceae bacterium]